MIHHLININIPTCKQFFQRLAVFRCIRVKRESRPLNINFKILLQSFNTPGNEIAPRSNIVRKYFKLLRIRHKCSLSYLIPGSGYYCLPNCSIGNAFLQTMQIRLWKVHLWGFLLSLVSHIMKRLDFGKLLGGERFKARCFNQILGPLDIVNIDDKDCIFPTLYNKAISIFNIDTFSRKGL